MRVSGTLAAAACAALPGAGGTTAAEARRITFTTKSPEARAAVEQAIESFAGTQVQPLARSRNPGNLAGARKSYREVPASSQNSVDRALACPEAKRRLASL